jgi:hypothetical protein
MQRHPYPLRTKLQKSIQEIRIPPYSENMLCSYKVLISYCKRAWQFREEIELEVISFRLVLLRGYLPPIEVISVAVAILCIRCHSEPISALPKGPDVSVRKIRNFPVYTACI